MGQFCKEYSTSPPHLGALLGALAFNIYFVRASRVLSTQEQSVIDWFAKTNLNFPPTITKLLQALVSNIKMRVLVPTPKSIPSIINSILLS